MADHGTFYWNELMTRSVEKAKAFYSKTLGWTYDDMPMEGGGMYYVAKSGDRVVGGLMQFEGPDMWFAYIAVDDLDARLKKLKEAGGTIKKEPFDIPGVGRIAIVADCNGAAQGWIVPAPQMM